MLWLHFGEYIDLGALTILVLGSGHHKPVGANQVTNPYTGSLGLGIQQGRVYGLVRPNPTNQCPGRFLGISSQNSSVSKSNWLYIYIMTFQSFFDYSFEFI